MNTIETKVKSYLTETLRNTEVDLDADTDLLNELLLDSLALLDLIVFLEESFEIEITRADLEEGKFGSIGSIAALVESRQNQ